MKTPNQLNIEKVYKGLINLSSQVVVAWLAGGPTRQHDVEVLSQAGRHYMLKTWRIAGGETENAARIFA